MKKFLFCTTAVAGVVGLVAYMNKNGLPVIGNLTMNLPGGLGVDKPFEWMMTGIHFLESKGIEGI
jgi:hypothetical protein